MSAIRGVPVVVSAPSGAGKTTMCRALMTRDEAFEFSVSYTTRPPRPGERDGYDYHFVDDAEFERLVAARAFLEWAPVHARRYGSARRATEDRLGAGYHVLFDIDVQGGRQIAEQLADARLVFVLPPSLGVLEERLRGRESDSEEQIQTRMQAAADEIRAAVGLYSHWIVNDDLGRAVDALEAAITGDAPPTADPGGLVEAFLSGQLEGVTSS